MKYPVFLRILHWLGALWVIPMLVGGYFWVRPMAEADPDKLDALKLHMAFGVGLVVLTALRLGLRLGLAHPRTEGLALWTHRLIYLCILIMPVSGFTMVFAAHLNEIVFAASGAPLPVDMSSVPGHFWHGLTALVLAAAVLLHLAGAFRDPETIARMT